MLIFKKKHYRTSEILKWLFATISLSALPILVSLISAINKNPLPPGFEQYVNVNDVIFMGLSVTISNLNDWRKGIDEDISNNVMFSSLVSIVVLCVLLGLSHSEPGLSDINMIISFILVLIPVTISLEVALRNSITQNR